MAGELRDFYASGGRTVVEMSGLGLRTDVEGLAQLSRATGVQIVAAAGFYIEDSWPEDVCRYNPSSSRGRSSRSFATASGARAYVRGTSSWP